MNNNLELENQDPIDNEISPRTNYGEGWDNENSIEKQIQTDAESLYPNNGYNEEIYCDVGAFERTMFIKGATHQSKKMYTEDDCYRILHNLMTDIKLKGVQINDDIDLKVWFKQLKKK